VLSVQQDTQNRKVIYPTSTLIPMLGKNVRVEYWCCVDTERNFNGYVIISSEAEIYSNNTQFLNIIDCSFTIYIIDGQVFKCVDSAFARPLHVLNIS
jgi:hypothetical protein